MYGHLDQIHSSTSTTKFMMSTFDYDKIIRYVQNEMQDDERRAFEQALHQDEGLRNEVGLCRELHRSLRMEFYPDDDEKALRTSLFNIQPAFFKTPAKIISFSLRKLSWSFASAAAVILLVLFIWQPWKTDLYSKYASIRMASVAERGATTDSLLESATVKFNAGNFVGSIPEFEKLLAHEPGNSYLQFYYAVALIETNQGAKSRNLLATLYNSNSLFHYDAAFYIALSYLKEKDPSRAADWLQKIPPEAAVYTKARALLAKIR